jgi:serine/threonine-protein kinase
MSRSRKEEGMATPTPVDSRTFLKRVQKSGLLEPRELKAAVKLLPETDRGRVVARALVDAGVLTKFQAELLLAGRTSGFNLGQYRILEQIGQGGMGRVYKAEHTAMGRVVAVKVLAPQHVKTEKARELFRREVRAAGKLAHPNIVTAFDASVSDGRHYLVMEFVDGPNLEQLVRERGPLPIGIACEAVRQTALGLQYAHEQGMVHRDIKPSNLLVQRGSGGPFVVKILDFGLARLQEPIDAGSSRHGTILAQPNVVMGTPDYLSPEQGRNLHAVDIRSDLYSLGCTLYHLLAGQVPFPGGTSLEKLIRHTSEEATPVEAFRPEVPPEVGAILRRLMARDAARRFQTPGELAAALAPHCTASPGDWTRSGDTAEHCLDTGSTNAGTVPGPGASPPDGEVSRERSTTGPGASLTPLSLADLPELVRERDLEERRGRKWRILLWSSGLIGLAAGAAAVVLAYGL